MKETRNNGQTVAHTIGHTLVIQGGENDMSKPLLITGNALKKTFNTSSNLTAHIEKETDSKSITVTKSPSTKTRKIRPVSFSLADPLEAKMTEYADCFSCFSTYIKRLIQRDMEQGGNT